MVKGCHWATPKTGFDHHYPLTFHSNSVGFLGVTSEISSVQNHKPLHVCWKFNHCLVGGWTHPFEKYAHQIGSWNPKDRGKNKKSLKPPPKISWKFISILIMPPFVGWNNPSYPYIFGHFQLVQPFAVGHLPLCRSVGLLASPGSSYATDVTSASLSASHW